MRRQLPVCGPQARRLSPPAVLLLLLSLAPAGGAAAVQTHPVLAVEPFPGIVGLEYRTDALARWAARDHAKAALLLFDLAPGMHPLGAAQVEGLARIRRGRQAGSDHGGDRDRSLFEFSFARAAVALGIVGEVYWVSPANHFGGPDPSGPVRAYLREAGVPEEELGTLALKDGCLRGTLGGAPFAACGIEGLPHVKAPVLFSFDTEFILAAVSSYGTNPVAEIRRLLMVLAAEKYSVLDAVVSASVENGFVPPDLRWIGETVLQAIDDPTLLSRRDAPKRWSRLQEISLLIGKRRYSEAYHELQPMLTVHEDDPAIQLFAAEALAGLGRKEQALEHAELACRAAPEYCTGLPWIGLNLIVDGDIDAGERFFAAGAAQRPALLFGQLQRGLFLFRAGRRTQALQAFRALSDGGRAIPGAFLAGALLLEEGDRQEALRQFDRAVEALRFDPGAAADSPETAAAVRAAARLYREEGAGDKAKLLEANPGLMRHKDEGPPESP